MSCSWVLRVIAFITLRNLHANVSHSLARLSLPLDVPDAWFIALAALRNLRAVASHSLAKVISAVTLKLHKSMAL